MDLTTGAFSPAEDRTCLSQPVPDNPGLVATPGPAAQQCLSDEVRSVATLVLLRGQFGSQFDNHYDAHGDNHGVAHGGNDGEG